jgi:hypothetical protein
MAEREAALVTPFWVRIAAETSLSPGWLLIAFPAVLYPAYLALEALFGRGLAAATDFPGDYEAWITPVITAGFGYVVMMLTYVARGTLRDLEDLRSVLLGGETAYVELRRQFTQFERSHLWIGGLVFLLAACLVQELVVGRWTRLLAGEWSLRDASFAIIILAVWLTAGRGAGYIIVSARPRTSARCA